MNRFIASSLIPVACALLLSGCGLEVGAAAAANGATAAESAKDAKEQQEKLEQGIEDAQAAAAKMREEAEAATE